MFFVVVDGLPADNPQQGEECSGIGHQGNLFCRCCFVGGTQIFKETPEGYHLLFYVRPSAYSTHILSTDQRFHQRGEPRIAEETVGLVRDQLSKAITGSAKDVQKLQTEKGIKDRIAQAWIERVQEEGRRKVAKSRSEGVRLDSDKLSEELEDWLDAQPGKKWNELMDLEGLDPHSDTPVEILHTALLGFIKYAWYGSVEKWKPGSRASKLFVPRLQATNTDGLTTPPIRAAYILEHKGALIGKHYKTLSQTMVFHLHDLVTPELFTLVKASGELAAVLWYPEVDDLEKYIVNICVFIV